MPGFDVSMFLALNASAQTPVGVVALARWASSGLLWLCAGVLVVHLWHPRARDQALACAVALLLAWCVVHAVRWALPMPRPAALGLGVQWVEHGLRPGFPSMHAAAAFAVAQCLGSIAPRGVVWLGWLCALLVAWSRVCLGVHFPSDVLVGALAGVCCALAAQALTAHLARWRAAVLTALGRS